MCFLVKMGELRVLWYNVLELASCGVNAVVFLEGNLVSKITSLVSLF